MNASIEANSVDPIRLLLQEQSDLGPHCLTKRLLKHFRRQQKQMTFVVIGVLRGNRVNPNQKTTS